MKKLTIYLIWFLVFSSNVFANVEVQELEKLCEVSDASEVSIGDDGQVKLSCEKEHIELYTIGESELKLTGKASKSFKISGANIYLESINASELANFEINTKRLTISNISSKGAILINSNELELSGRNEINQVLVKSKSVKFSNYFKTQLLDITSDKISFSKKAKILSARGITINANSVVDAGSEMVSLGGININAKKVFASQSNSKLYALGNIRVDSDRINISGSMATPLDILLNAKQKLDSNGDIRARKLSASSRYVKFGSRTTMKLKMGGVVNSLGSEYRDSGFGDLSFRGTVHISSSGSDFTKAKKYGLKIESGQKKIDEKVESLRYLKKGTLTFLAAKDLSIHRIKSSGLKNLTFSTKNGNVKVGSAKVSGKINEKIIDTFIEGENVKIHNLRVKAKNTVLSAAKDLWLFNSNINSNSTSISGTTDVRVFDSIIVGDSTSISGGDVTIANVFVSSRHINIHASKQLLLNRSRQYGNQISISADSFIGEDFVLEAKDISIVAKNDIVLRKAKINADKSISIVSSNGAVILLNDLVGKDQVPQLAEYTLRRYSLETSSQNSFIKPEYTYHPLSDGEYDIRADQIQVTGSEVELTGVIQDFSSMYLKGDYIRNTGYIIGKKDSSLQIGGDVFNSTANSQINADNIFIDNGEVRLDGEVNSTNISIDTGYTSVDGDVNSTNISIDSTSSTDITGNISADNISISSNEIDISTDLNMSGNISLDATSRLRTRSIEAGKTLSLSSFDLKNIKGKLKAGGWVFVSGDINSKDFTEILKSQKIDTNKLGITTNRPIIISKNEKSDRDLMINAQSFRLTSGNSLVANSLAIDSQYDIYLEPSTLIQTTEGDLSLRSIRGNVVRQALLEITNNRLSAVRRTELNSAGNMTIMADGRIYDTAGISIASGNVMMVAKGGFVIQPLVLITTTTTTKKNWFRTKTTTTVSRTYYNSTVRGDQVTLLEGSFNDEGEFSQSDVESKVTNLETDLSKLQTTLSGEEFEFFKNSVVSHTSRRYRGVAKLGKELLDEGSKLIDKAKKLAHEIKGEAFKFYGHILRPILKESGTAQRMFDRLEDVTGVSINMIGNTIDPTKSYKVSTYREAFDGYKRNVMGTVYDMAKINRRFFTDGAGLLISDDFEKFVDEAFDIQDETLTAADLVTNFDNVARVGLTALGNSFAGPLGGALAGALVDRFVTKTAMSESDLLKSFVINLAAGYAGQSSAVASNLTRDVGNRLLNDTSYNSRDFLLSVATGLAVDNIDFNTGDIDQQALVESLEAAAEGLVNSSITQFVNDNRIDLRDAYREAAMAGMNAQMSAELKAVMHKPISELTPKQVKELNEYLSNLTKDIEGAFRAMGQAIYKAMTNDAAHTIANSNLTRDQLDEIMTKIPEDVLEETQSKLLENFQSPKFQEEVLKLLNSGVPYNEVMSKLTAFAQSEVVRLRSDGSLDKLTEELIKNGNSLSVNLPGRHIAEALSTTVAAALILTYTVYDYGTELYDLNKSRLKFMKENPSATYEDWAKHDKERISFLMGTAALDAATGKVGGTVLKAGKASLGIIKGIIKRTKHRVPEVLAYMTSVTKRVIGDNFHKLNGPELELVIESTTDLVSKADKLGVTNVDGINDLKKIASESLGNNADDLARNLDDYIEAAAKGAGPRLPVKQVGDTFKNGVYYNRKLKTDEVFYKYHGVNNRTGRKHTWLVKSTYSSEKVLREKLAILPEWGVEISKRTKFVAPKGTWVSEGIAAPQKGISSMPGGDYQSVISNVPKAWIVNTVEAFK
jgi:hypothetical protein